MSFKGLSCSTSEIKLGDMHFEGYKLHTTNCNVSKSIEINELSKNSHHMTSTFCETPDHISFTNNCFSLSLTHKNIDFELKFNVEEIESQYQHLSQELLRMRSKALEAVEKKWIAKKKMITQ